MSIKKLGGTRLRLVVALASVLAVFGAVAAFGVPRVLDADFGVSQLSGGDMAELTITDLPFGSGQRYYLVPVEDSSGDADLAGWERDENQSGTGADDNPFIFDEDLGYIDLGVPTSGNHTIYILTKNEYPNGDKDTRMEIRLNSPTATPATVSSDTLTVLEH